MARIFYKLTSFIASAIIIPLILYVVYTAVDELGKIRQATVALQIDIALLKQSVDSGKSYTNADLDAAKAQIRELGRKIDLVRGDTSQIVTYVDPDYMPPRGRNKVKKVKYRR
jgi:hypothetical protein